MAFVSGAFILFIAFVTLFYFIVKEEYRWIVLLIASYLFYWINSKYLVFIMLFMTVVAYMTAKIIDHKTQYDIKYLKEHADFSSQEKKAYRQKRKLQKRRVLFCGVIVDLGILLFLKYFNFFTGNMNGLLGKAGMGAILPTLNFMLPLGISFYTLQAIAYMTDVYRGKYEADNNIFKFMLFMSYFPQIVQGPIARYDKLAAQLYEGHRFEYKRLTFGVQLILWGFIKKLVIADRIAVPVDEIFNNFQNYNGLLVLLAAMGYGLQVYTDFSGGMDIARGISQIFGIDIQLNFKQPYFAKSIEEFWRRWHITLGGWMKDYVFYPLSLSKKFGNLSKSSRKLFGNYIGKKLPSFIAMFFVYFLVGFWHGAEWKYIFYGLWNGVFIMLGILLEDVYNTIKNRLHINENTFSWKGFQMIRTFILCSVGRFFSRAEGTFAAVFMMRMVLNSFFNVAFLVDGTLVELGLNTANWILLFIMIIAVFIVDLAHERGIRIRETIANQGIVFRWFVYYVALFIVLVFGMYGEAYDSASFIYQQF